MTSAGLQAFCRAQCDRASTDPRVGGWRFDPQLLLSMCRSVLEQDTDPRGAPDVETSALHGSSATIVVHSGFSIMASAMITVPTTASRFALLQVDSDSDSDVSDRGKTAKDVRQDTGKNQPGKGGVGKAAQSNDKRKEKKKKKREQQQSEANELRSMAFKKNPQKPSCASPLTLQGVAGELLHSATTDKAVPPEGWQQWKKRDEQITNDLYEADLEKALMMSKLEFEQEKRDDIDTATTKNCGGGGKREKKKSQQGKDKKTTVSLHDFQAEGSLEQHGKRLEKEEPIPANPVVDQKMQFFNILENDVSKIIQREKRREQFSNSQYQECSISSEYETDPRAEQLKDNLEKKDLEIIMLKKTISAWEVRYREVKARNTQLLKMLQQGEMKDKADILLQVEELLNIKEELSSQVTFLHASLEQEKSKVKALQIDQPKHQGNKRSKKISETDL